jgi:hypothetical protein
LDLAEVQSSRDFDFLSFEDFLLDVFLDPSCDVELADFLVFFFFSDLNDFVEVVLTLVFLDDLDEDFCKAFFICS